MMNHAEKERLADNRELTALRRAVRTIEKPKRPAMRLRIKELKFKLKNPGLYNRGYYHKEVLG